MIGKGSFARVNSINKCLIFLIQVYFAKRKSTNDFYAIKALRKERILKDENGMVL